jgi:hypothetical protein
MTSLLVIIYKDATVVTFFRFLLFSYHFLKKSYQRQSE